MSESPVKDKVSAPPLFTMRQCNKRVWVIKRRDTTVYAAVESVRGVDSSLSCYKVLVCTGVDPSFVSLLISCIQSFSEVSERKGLGILR